MTTKTPNALEEWEESLLERYPQNGSDKPAGAFRNFEADARPSVREFGTPNIMRGMISTGERAHSTVRAVVVQMSAATSTPLLPGPITSTRLPANASGTR